MSSRVVATCFTLISFAAALFAGLAAGNPIVTVLGRSLLVGAVCFFVGSLVGVVAQAAVAREVAEHIRRFPLPGPSDAEAPVDLSPGAA